MADSIFPRPIAGGFPGGRKSPAASTGARSLARAFLQLGVERAHTGGTFHTSSSSAQDRICMLGSQALKFALLTKQCRIKASDGCAFPRCMPNVKIFKMPGRPLFAVKETVRPSAGLRTCLSWFCAMVNCLFAASHEKPRHSFLGNEQGSARAHAAGIRDGRPPSQQLIAHPV